MRTGRTLPERLCSGPCSFGPTSDLYKKLVVAEQKVDQLRVDVPSSIDPSLFTVLARLKSPVDATYVRDEILSTFARARTTLVTDGSPGRRSIVQSILIRADRRQLRTGRRRGGRFRRLHALVRDRQRLLQYAGRGVADRSSAHRFEIFRRSRPHRHDTVARATAGWHRAGASAGAHRQACRAFRSGRDRLAAARTDDTGARAKRHRPSGGWWGSAVRAPEVRTTPAERETAVHRRICSRSCRQRGPRRS